MNTSLINTCCFIGHRKIEVPENLENRLYNLLEDLIINKNVRVFLFGSRIEFNDICYEVVSKLKEKYPDLKRIYVRAEYPYISKDYENFLLGSYEETYFPEKIQKAGRLVYVERNCEIIDKSAYCIFYYKEDYKPDIKKQSKRSLSYYQPKSGTKLAYDYAVMKKKRVYNMCR